MEKQGNGPMVHIYVYIYIYMWKDETTGEIQGIILWEHKSRSRVNQ